MAILELSQIMLSLTSETMGRCLMQQTRPGPEDHKQPIILLYFEFENQ